MSPILEVIGAGAVVGDNQAIVDTSGATTPSFPVTFSTFHNGTFTESFATTITESAGVVTMALEQSGGGDLTMRFSDGHTVLDTSPAVTIALTTGSDTSPTINYVYILQSGKVVALSTAAWPTTEHIKVAAVLVPSAAFVASDGAYVHQNWNDHATSTDDQGHLTHIAERVRRIGASYFSGLAGAGTSDYLTLAGTTVDLKIASGVVYQMHRHTVAASDTSAGDVVLVKNWSGDAYHNITNLYDIVADSGGTTISNNRFFNIVVWGVANQTGTYAPVIINLPSGAYTSQSGAESDLSGFDDFTIPREYNLDSSTGFLICRLTVQKKSSSWVYASTTDLRGTTPQTASGGAAGVITAFSDNQFTVFNITDSTKIVDLDVSGVTTATTRTWTVEDVDGSVAVLNTIALGGGAAPTLGTIGGSGPTTAAQNAWGQVDIGGTTYWVPLWV